MPSGRFARFGVGRLQEFNQSLAYKASSTSILFMHGTSRLIERRTDFRRVRVNTKSCTRQLSRATGQQDRYSSLKDVAVASVGAVAPQPHATQQHDAGISGSRNDSPTRHTRLCTCRVLSVVYQRNDLTLPNFACAIPNRLYYIFVVCTLACRPSATA